MKRIIEVAVLVVFLAMPGRAFAQWVACTGGSETCTTADVAIGTTSPTQALHVLKNQNNSTVMTIQNLDTGASAAGVFRAQSDAAFGSLFAHGSGRTLTRYGVALGGWVELAASGGNGLAVATIPSAPLIFGTANAERMRIDPTGKVGIGTASPAYALDVNGIIRATNVIGASYQDFAEWVPATVNMEPGTVVVLNEGRTNEVMPSKTSYATSVAGVVSPQPGILLGEESPSKEMIATAGRVKVHVTTSNGPIRVGDLLVTSDKPGAAMRSEPLNVAGARIHRPGTLIGKALEPLEKGDGEILVLLSLQ